MNSSRTLWWIAVRSILAAEAASDRLVETDKSSGNVMQAEMFEKNGGLTGRVYCVPANRGW